MSRARARREESAGPSIACEIAVLLGLTVLLAAPGARAEEAGAGPASEVEAEQAARGEAGAPPAAPTPPVRRVGEVTATATRAEREALDVAGNVTVIDREEIERSGARTLPDLLRREAGILVTNSTTNPAGTFVDARGFNNGGGNGAGLLVLVDGRRANEPDTGSADWALLPLQAIESIEIVRGPASALYGDGAIGGVIEIRTRPREGPARGTLRGLFGSYDSAGGSLRASGGLGDLRGSLFVDGLRSDGYRRRSAYDSQDLRASLEGTFLDRLVVGSSGRYHHDDREFPGSLTFPEIAALGRRAGQPNASENRGEVDAWAWDGWIEAALAPELELRALPHFSTRDDFLRDVTTFFGFASPFEIENEKRQGGVDLQLRLDRPLLGLASRLLFGASFLRDDAERSSVSDPFFRQRTRGERIVAGGFVQEELWLRDDLLLAVGLRYDGGLYRLETTDLLTDARAVDEPDFGALSPKASLTWRFLPAASAYLSWARGFRLPDFDEDLPILGALPGDPPTLPSLRLQQSDSFEVGDKWGSPRASAGLSLYWMRVRNEIVFEPLSFANLNLDRVRHRGIELSGALRPLRWLGLEGAYTFDDVKILEDDNPAVEGARMPITPRHRGSLGAFAEIPTGLDGLALELGAQAIFVGPRILANDFDRRLAQLSGYQTLDLLLRLRRALGRILDATLSFAVRNATGERYEDFGARGSCYPDRLCAGGTPTAFVYPAAGRRFELGLVLERRP